MQRRAARRVALKALFQVDVGGAEPGRALGAAQEGEKLNPGALEFARALLEGALANLAEVDELIRRYSRRWAFDRLPRVDKNLLRLALYELLYLDDIPVPVTINEAVELAKEFGTPRSSSFVNGVLAAVARERR